MSAYTRTQAVITKPDLPRFCRVAGMGHRFRVDSPWESSSEDVALGRIREVCRICDLVRYQPRYVGESEWDTLRGG